MELPTIGNYGEYSSSNYGAHTRYVRVGCVTIWYSYETPVAFQVTGHERVVRENDWGVTTGKHLSWIDGGNKKARVDSETFERLWNEQVSPMLGR